MQVKDTRSGDVIIDADRTVWQRTGDNIWNWSTFSGPVGYYGEWLPEYGPKDPVVLLVRDGTPAYSVAENAVSADTVAQAEGQ